ncbi:class I SAM-dependent methyltransferase [Salisediminibacterium halotolerans]|uniref:class I SAM-dependent methyltransferase n=1 Tax=Salisediminibacterium halotolerans TaxID=517425 RepID=UPI000EAF8882|nr:class I SAM-dependent methyltransferase [Salisediminibacterium halotolerans]RLJ73257.1 methyltransferase family protein [Actinophytocola xinjiangensis]RPE86679.1 methyltransferase family protein [Salisediminibacterium halotolerans]TWG34054.1 methyltransferase family protein [Salisediminibacterium halotolerans]GEL08901.1 hypothetical protein SHA02_23170 [Salisediminibacterium halotolerans]
MIDDTGERVIPEYMKPDNSLLLEHLARYDFAKPYAKGRVLDLACGSGYGAKMITKARKNQISETLGVDADPEIVEYARRTYHHPLLHFKTGDALNPDLTDEIGTFNTILSFETIEHVPDDQAFLTALVKLLKPGGTLVLSTPFGDGRGIPSGSPFHYHQLTETEFHQLVHDGYNFDHVDVYLQNGVAIEREKRGGVHYPLGIAVCRKSASST